MEEYQQKMMEYIFASQVLILANQLRSDLTARGENVKGDMIPEAIRLISDKSERIFANMSILS